MRSILQKSKGYTLIEIILVIVILVVAVPPLVSLFSRNLTNNVNSEIYTKALLYAEERMEQVLSDKKAKSYTFITTVGRYPEDTPETGFSRQVSITDANKIINGIPYAEIIVTVSHENIQNITLSAYVTNYN